MLLHVCVMWCLVLSVLAALGTCVGYMCVLAIYVCCGAWSAPGVVSAVICVGYIVGCLAHTWCKRGVALVKFQSCYGLTYMYL